MEKTQYFVTLIFLLVMIVFGAWCTLNFSGNNRVTGGFLTELAGLRNFYIPWLVVLAFVVFVVVLNCRKR